MLFLTILSTSCRNDRAELVSQEKGRKLTLTASMPQNEAGMRVGLEKGADGNTLVARWKAGDKVAFIFEQTGTLTAPVEVTISSIEQDGKLARLSIEVPEIINVQQEYTIHAFCGIPGTGARVQDGEILVDILPLRENRLEDIVVPVIAEEDVDPDETDIELDFSHLGSIEYVDLKNSSGEELRVSNCHLYPVKGDAEEWRYVPGNGKIHFYKVSAENVLSVDGTKPNPIKESGSAVSIAPGATHTFAVWHYPKKRNIPEFGISMQTDGGAVLSRNTRVAKPFAMTPGKAYRVRAEWKSGILKIEDDIVEGVPAMTLTTEMEVGQTITLYIKAEDKDKPDVWIDLNNNKIKDAGERVMVFEQHEEYTLGAQTIVVYGNITEFVCKENRLTALDVQENKALELLECQDNLLKTLDVSKNTELEELHCDNNSLATLDVSKNIELDNLVCSTNALTALDVSNNAKLTFLYCDSNKELTSLKISNSINEFLFCRHCKLSAEALDNIFRTLPDVSGSEKDPKVFVEKNPGADDCHPEIATKKGWKVDVKGKPLPTPAGNSMTLTTKKMIGETIELYIDAEDADQKNVWIDLNNNKIKDAGEDAVEFEVHKHYRLDAQTIVVYGNVTKFFCKGARITALDVQKNNALEELVCDENKLTALDVRKNVKLEKLHCSENKLSTLDVRNNPELELLFCDYNSLTTLDVSKNRKLEKLVCSGNKLAALDVSGNPELEFLHCENNKELTTLDIGSGIDDQLYSRGCKLGAEELDNIFRILPDVRGKGKEKKILVDNTPGAADCHPEIATKKGWTVDVKGKPLPPTPPGNRMTMTTKKAIGEKIKLWIYAEEADRPNVWIDLNNNYVKDAGENVTVFGTEQEYTLGSRIVTVYGNVFMLTSNSNKLTSLDVSKNTALVDLGCYGNELTSLDVSKNTALKGLFCGANLFTSLDVSKNTKLDALACDYNRDLTSLKIPGSIRDRLHCKECKLSAEMLNEIFRTLPDVTKQPGGKKTVYIYGNPGTDECDKSIATSKGWKVSLDPKEW
ncbi:hypothetical protein HQ43_07010 [Porphyromonas canoris]|uniref:Uncharacterized protein n=2 Tax=Porphyromonas canoris TaxID=36875 RepID=A0ABR4XJF1_9PORP|nr:hypothetical protein HQ43_07010 [Porphyromonas canoris]